MTAFITVLNGILSMRIVQYAMLVLLILLITLSGYQALRIKWLAVELKSAKADLAWVQGALNLQNEAVKQLGIEQKQLEEQKQAKAKEAAQAKATASKRADEIMKLKMSKDCKEVAQWGIEQGLLQSLW